MITSINQMFNDIAKPYDKINNVITLGMNLKIKKMAIGNVAIESDFKVLDICTGTGDIAIHIAKNIVKDGKVIGVDFSENMLEIARKKAVGIENLEFLYADALALPFGDGEFDACFISFGLRNLPNFKQGIEEMKRVTKKGGFVINIDTGKPKGIVKFFHQLYFFNIVPILGKLFGGKSSPYKYLPQSTKNFPNQDELVRIFEEIGLTDVKNFDFLFGSISQQIGRV